ncbi:MAG: lipase family protein [Eubacteriales bacterium]|nr:lipase family protein [Eubacteriales bacterium]
MNNHDLLDMVEYAALAYAKHPPYDPHGPTQMFSVDRVGAQFLIRKKDCELQIAFRGTDTLRGVLTDIRFWKKTIPYGNTKTPIRIHSGFLDAYTSSGVRDVIHSFMGDDVSKITVVGHSYGAALAVLCAVDLEQNFRNREYTAVLFGCPRVGNGAFVRSYNRRVFNTFRVENANDAVTKLPFALMGYRHVGIKLHVGFPRCFGIMSVRNHNLKNYYSQIWQRIKN